MKINTDGTLLGALSHADFPERILDIGTGTGVIALMLAQRFPKCIIDAVEIEEQASVTAHKNFINSLFNQQLQVYNHSFQNFSKLYPAKKYDLIVSNPPFFINSLKNPEKNKQLARHTNTTFFKDLISFAYRHLSGCGRLTLILPPDIAELCATYAIDAGLHLVEDVSVKSFNHVPSHRKLVSFAFQNTACINKEFVIYEAQKQYSQQFIKSLKDFFIIF